MRILLESYGCTLNKGEASELKESLIADGQTIVEADQDFEKAILFTCGVIETTQFKILKRIRELAGQNKEIIICGCLGAICENEILKINPGTRIFTPSENVKIASQLCENPIETVTSIDGAIGILPIASGCLGECSYCITRFARGELKSRPVGVILERARRLIEAGAYEVQVTAQDTGIYGKDIGTDLPKLLNDLAALGGDHMFRVGMMTPNSVIEKLDEFVETFSHPKIFNFIHLPVQSGDDAILSSMERKYSVRDFEKIVKAFKTLHPNLTLSTDIIVGFPGESDENFKNSLELMRRIKPDIINITRFSPRPGTAASTMPDQIQGWRAKERSRQLTELRFELSRQIFSSFVGTELEALATEYRKPGTTFFRTRDYRPVIVEGEIPLGSRILIKIIGNEQTHMLGREVNYQTINDPGLTILNNNQ